LHAFLIFSMCATCPVHIILHFIIILMFGEYKLWSSSLCNFLQPPPTSPFLGSNILPSTLFSTGIADKTYGNVVHLIYLEMTVIPQNYIHNKINVRLNLGNFCYHSV
jgi:hypothetical protein